MSYPLRPLRYWWIPLLAVSAGVGLWFSGRLVVGQWKTPGRGPRESAQQAASEVASPVPRVAIEKTEHNFGHVNPSETCEYEFVVRNVGDAPLHLARGGTTCHCTMSELPAQPVPPGGQASIRVRSKTGQQHGHFSHVAKVFTNDPACGVLHLKITGTVLSRLAADPAQVVFGKVRAGEEATAEFTVYSQTWRAFDLVAISASHPAMQWDVVPADAETLGRLKALAGYRIRLAMPGEAPGRSFWETLQITAVPEDAERRPEVLKVDVAGTTLRRIGLFADRMDAQGVVQLGTFASAQGRKTRVMVKVRDGHRALGVLGIQTEPDFVRAELKPLGGGAKYGLYALEIEVPPGSPPGDHAASSQGRVRVITDHPHMPQIEVPLAFIVTSR